MSGRDDWTCLSSTNDVLQFNSRRYYVEVKTKIYKKENQLKVVGSNKVCEGGAPLAYTGEITDFSHIYSGIQSIK